MFNKLHEALENKNIETKAKISALTENDKYNLEKSVIFGESIDILKTEDSSKKIENE